MLKKIALLFTVFISFVMQNIFAQPVVAEKDSVMRSGNKIYVVLAVCLTILFGLILYLVRIDRKIKGIENKN
jgi:hypothetical protein